MFLPALISLLAGSLIALILAIVFPVLTAGEPPARRLPARLPVVIAAAALLIVSARKLRAAALPFDNELLGALVLVCMGLGGVITAWAIQLAVFRPLALRDASLLASLLVAPLIAVLAGNAMIRRPTPAGLALWFANGLACQALFGAIERRCTKPAPIVRRREPPLPT